MRPVGPRLQTAFDRGSGAVSLCGPVDRVEIGRTLGIEVDPEWIVVGGVRLPVRS